MDSHGSSGSPCLFWNLSCPQNVTNPALVILLSNWVYGLLPYCGPGLREKMWMIELAFQDEIREFLNHRGIATLTLECINGQDSVPTDPDILSATHIPDVFTTIKDLVKNSRCSLHRSVILSHGFGSRKMCEMVSYGLKPAGYIIAGGIYSDTEAVLTQKYLPVKEAFRSQSVSDNLPIDLDTELIMNNIGKIMYASRKGRGKIRLKDGENSLDIYLPEALFSEKYSPEILFSALEAPSLILHGAGDLDVPVSNAFFLETKLKQKNSSVSRIVMLDRDHWFREMPPDNYDRILERLSGGCSKNPIDYRFMKNCLFFIKNVLKLQNTRDHNSAEMVSPYSVNKSIDFLSEG